MIAIKITHQKDFMSKLLATALFDDFLAEDITIDTYNTFKIDGRVHKEFYKNTDYSDSEQLPSEPFSKWSVLRPVCLDLIKGKQTPLGFKFVLRLSEQKKTEIFKDLDLDLTPNLYSPCININFTSGTVTIITGISYSIFTLDKETEKAWDRYIPSFLESNGIDTEII